MVRMLKLMGYLVGFFAVATLLLLAVVLQVRRASEPGNDGPLMIAIAVSLVVTIGAFAPYLNFAMRRALVFAPTAAAPVDEAELRHRLKALTGFGAPVEAVEEGKRIRFRWKYLDTSLRGALERRKLTGAYELIVRLDPIRHEAILTDIKRSIRFRSGVSGVHLGAGISRGYLEGVEIHRGYEIGDDLAVRKVEDYRFEPSAVKRPVMHTLAEAGWTVRFAMW